MCSVQPLNRKAMPLWKAFPLSVLFVLCRRLHHESTGLPSLLKAIQGQSSLFKGFLKKRLFICSIHHPVPLHSLTCVFRNPYSAFRNLRCQPLPATSTSAT